MGLPSPPSSPPLAAISANNEVIVLPKHKNGAASHHQRRDGAGRGGAASRLREECERLFCETMKTVFLGERSTAKHGSRLTGASAQQNSLDYASYPSVQGHQGLRGYSRRDSPSPPSDDDFGCLRRASVSSGFSAVSVASSASSFASASAFASADEPFNHATPTAWVEIWDYAGGASFRGFLSEDAAANELTLFAFFDAHMLVTNGDLKKSLMALIELADSALECAHLVVCVDRHALPLLDDAASLMKGMQWAGFSLTTLDAWTGGEGVDVTSQDWVFMGMEL